MARHAKTQFHGPAVSNQRLTLTEVDFDVAMIEKYLVETGNGLVNCLLGGEQQASVINVSGQCRPFQGCCNSREEFDWQRFGRLDINADASEFAMRRHRRDCNVRIVGQRADDLGRP